jgi:endonuclease/exonuclease/phosphatase (EEP) superfamily protein YafD
MVPPGFGPRTFDPSAQAPAVRALLRRLRGARRPTLVIGDFNVADREPLYRTLRGRLGDSFRDAGSGLGLTWGGRRVKFVRIDYVFHDRRWATRSARAVTLPGSDHRLVTADLVGL